MHNQVNIFVLRFYCWDFFSRCVLIWKLLNLIRWCKGHPCSPVLGQSPIRQSPPRYHPPGQSPIRQSTPRYHPPVQSPPGHSHLGHYPPGHYPRSRCHRLFHCWYMYIHYMYIPKKDCTIALYRHLYASYYMCNFSMDFSPWEEKKWLVEKLYKTKIHLFLKNLWDSKCCLMRVYCFIFLSTLMGTGG